MNFEHVRSYATKKALAPLNDYVARDKVDMSIYYPNTVQMHTVENTLYGLPATFSDNVVFYNKTMFDKAGVAYPDASWDWNKLITTAKQFTKGDTYGYGPAWWPMYLFLYNTNILTPDNSKCALNTPEGLQAIQSYADLSTKDGVSANAAATKAQSDYDRFVAGKLAMFVAGPWAVKPFNQAITTFQWDIADHPKGTTQGTFLYSNAYSISAGSKNKDAAWEFLKFASGVEGQTIRQQGQFEIATIKSVADSIFVPSMKGQSPAHPEIFLNATAYGKKLPDHARLQEIEDAIQPELDLVLSGKKSVKDAMNAACTAVDGVIAQK
jgi:multiple sugar transport system substrate-binding protein